MLRRMELERYDDAFLAEVKAAAEAERARHRRRGAGGRAMRARSPLVAAPCARARRLQRGQRRRASSRAMSRASSSRSRRRSAAASSSSPSGAATRSRPATCSSASTTRRRRPRSPQARRELARARRSSPTCSRASARRRSPSSRRRSPRRRPRSTRRARISSASWQLFERRVVSEARLDQAREAVSVAEARLPRPSASATWRRCRRAPPEIDAGERAVEAARAALAQAETRLATPRREGAGRRPHRGRAITSPARSPPPARRCSRCCPTTAARSIFFVPEPARPGARRSAASVAIACDGCPAGLDGAGELPRAARRSSPRPSSSAARTPRQARLPRRGEARRRGGRPAARPAGRRDAAAAGPRHERRGRPSSTCTG